MGRPCAPCCGARMCHGGQSGRLSTPRSMQSDIFHIQKTAYHNFLNFLICKIRIRSCHLTATEMHLSLLPSLPPRAEKWGKTLRDGRWNQNRMDGAEVCSYLRDSMASRSVRPVTGPGNQHSYQERSISPDIWVGGKGKSAVENGEVTWPGQGIFSYFRKSHYSQSMHPTNKPSCCLPQFCSLTCQTLS